MKNLLFSLFKIKKTLNALLVVCCLSLNLTTSAQSDTYTICIGESVTLSNLEIPPVPPQGPAGTQNCTSLVRRIAPNDESVSKVGDTYMLSPSTTTTYTFTSNYGPCCPGDICTSSPTSTEIIEVIIENCQPVPDEIISICKGESVTLSNLGLPPAPPQGPPGTPNCTYLVRRIEPNDESVSKVGDTYMLSPSITTTYTITSKYGPCCPHDNCLSSPTTTETIEVVVEGCEEPSLVDQYPWLRTLVEFNSCAGTIITEYDAGYYRFLHIDSPSGGALYFQDGTFYCKDAPSYSCVQLYNLSKENSSFTCGNPTTDNSVFDDYQWLSNLVNPSNCNNETISVYEIGIFSFVYLRSGTYGDLYFEDGTFYCSDGPGYSCVQLYNLNQMVANWSCNTILSDIPGCTDPKANNYQSSATINDGSCIYDLVKNFDYTKIPLLSIVDPPTQKKSYISFNVYPNPASDKVFIEVDITADESIQITLLDMQGKILQNTTAITYDNIIEMDVSEYADGVYMIELKNNYTSITEKLVIK